MRTMGLFRVCRCLAGRRVLTLVVAIGMMAALVGAPAGTAVAAAHPAGGSGLSPGRAPAYASGNSFPTKGGILFGGTDALAKLAPTDLGRNLAIVRVYYKIGNTFPSYVDAEHMKEGSTLLVSLDSNGQSYASIAAGTYDASITAFLTAVNAAAVQYDLSSIFITFEHEPDTSQHASLGTAAQFVAAWDHVHQLAVSNNLDWNQNAGGRLLWALILTNHTYAVGTDAGGYWPGPGEADIAAVDGYNSYGCGNATLQTPAALFTPVLSFAAANGGLPVIIAEWASNAAQASAQATFITQMQAFLAAHHKKIKAADYWDGAGTTCSYIVDNNSGSLAALKTLGAAAVMQGTAKG
jgi:hypothetical protein